MHLPDESALYAMGYRVSPDDPKNIVPLPKTASKDLTVAELENLARKEYQGVLQAEKQVSARYWHLGDYLTVLREKLKAEEQLAHGEWQEWLTVTLKIDLNRARRAMRIRKLYERPEDCSEKALSEALNYTPRVSAETSKAPVARRSSASFSSTPLTVLHDKDNDEERLLDEQEDREFGEEPADLGGEPTEKELEAAERFVAEVGVGRAKVVLSEFLERQVQ